MKSIYLIILAMMLVVCAKAQAITGSTTVCVGGYGTLSGTPSGGTWSSSNVLVAPVYSGGVYIGHGAGTAIITYTTGTGSATTVVTVTADVAPFTGYTTMCVGTPVTLTDTPAGGTWSSSNPTIAAVSSAGVVTGYAAGSTYISYTLASGCTYTGPVSVNPLPAITGSGLGCVGSTVDIVITPMGGAWTFSPSGIVSPTTGIGIAAGVTTIAYTLTMTGCSATRELTVNPAPAPITGTTAACAGYPAALTCATPGGTWSGSASAIATVGYSTGIVTGITAGTTVISYTLTGTGCASTIVFTVLAAPATITGPDYICMGTTATQSCVPAGGTWSSSNPSIATIGPGTGVITALTPGTSNITYSLGSGCSAARTVTVGVPPPSITGALSTCYGSTITLTCAASGGVWTSATPSVATVVSATGVVTAVSTGTATISYQLSMGCVSTVVVTVNSLPGPIMGPDYLCIGSTGTQSCMTAGGTWSSSNIAVATIGAATGIITSAIAGTAMITYTLATGCYSMRPVTVNSLPAPISGIAATCPGSTTTLSSATSGGTWSSGNLSIATIDAAGIVTGIAPGTATISYTTAITSCSATRVVTVNPPPTAILGTTSICMGMAATLTCATPGGAWSSSNMSIATISSTTGIVNGIAPGTANITYTVSATGCYTTQVVTINPGPGAITGTVAVCMGALATLTGTGGDTWNSSDIIVAVIDPATGIFTGLIAGTANITYTTLSSGCYATITVTVTPLPSAIAGPTSVCAGMCATLTDASPGGTWSISPVGVATIVPGTGVYCGVSAGTATVTYTTGCLIPTIITVNAPPAPIIGTLTICPGMSTTLYDATPGGTWSVSNPGVAAISPATGTVSAIASGTSTVTYTLGTGCIRTAVLSVNPLPAAITGPSAICDGSCGTMTCATSGGTWSCSSLAIATISSSGGIACGVSTGVLTISYTLSSTGCASSKALTVNPVPGAITGPATVCLGTTVTLSSTTAGGIWSSANLAIATIGTSTGIATGNAPAPVTITYTLGTGCRSTRILTVNALPATIGGTAAVCEGLTTTLTNTSLGGAWTSGDPMIAMVTTGTGVVTGVAAGTATITYILSATGCFVTSVVTVNPVPAPITGPGALCLSTTASLSSATPGGAWISSNPGILTIGPSTGMVTSTSVGTAIITYTLSSGCYATRIMTVVTAPSPITGTTTTCEGLSTTLTCAPASGVWTSAAPTIVTVAPGTGIVTGVAAGTATVTYTLPGTGCNVTQVVTVNPAPAPITGPSSFCMLTTAILSSATPGGVWNSSDPGIAYFPSPLIGNLNNVATGVVTVTYTLPTGCIATKNVAVILAPYPITGPGEVCDGSTVSLGNTVSGGTWTSSDASIASITAGGIATGNDPGIVDITYTLSSGCFSTFSLIVNITPAAITGPTAICEGAVGTLSCTPPGGTWISSSPAIATVDMAGVVYGFASGVVGITYATAAGCASSTLLTVNALPAAITGTGTVCMGSTTTLTSGSGGGTWISSSGIIATVSASAGAVTGVAPGTAWITYTLGTGCSTTTEVTVYPVPASISGPGAVCAGSSVTQSCTTPGGIWTSSNTAVASIDITSGVVNGLASGVVTLSYTLPTGCYSTRSLTVNATPTAMTGPSTMCDGSSITLSSTPSGGTWTSSDPSIASVSGSGLVVATLPGVTTITYSLAAGCISTKELTVNPHPGPLGGTISLCIGSVSTLSSSSGPGTWTSSSSGIATVGLSTGIVAAVSVGNSTITYTAPTGCTSTTVVTVNPLPPAITGPSTACIGVPVTVSCAATGGTWDSGDPSVATIGASTGIVTGVAPGTTTITYMIPTGCYTTSVMTASATPSVGVSATPSSCGPLYTAVATGATTYSWAPSTGITYGTTMDTADIYAGAAVTYTVTGTTVGCSDTATVTISANRILGHLSFGGPAPSGTSAQVWLIQYDPTDSSITAQDSLTTCLDGGAPYYEFTGKPAGSYLVKAKLLSSVAGTSDYFPTYGASAPTWDLATPITHAAASDSQHINMLYGTVPSGPGFISGYVYMGAGKGTATEVPVAHMAIYLRNTAGQVLTYTYTDASGAYFFTGVAPGSYLVYPEEMSYNTIPAPITVSAGIPADGVGFRKRTTTGIIEPWTLPNAVKPVIATKVAVYPNPANDMVVITNAKGMQLSITDISGREVYTIKITSEQQPVNIADLAGGIYMIAAGNANGEVQRVKLVKQ